MTDHTTGGELDPALAAALERTLAPPALPRRFRAGLEAAVARAEQVDIAAMRARYEHEQAQRLDELRRNYVRVKRRTLAAMVVGAFAAGAAAMLLMPWLVARAGPLAPFAMACAGVAAGLGIVWYNWRMSRDGADLRA